MEAVEDMQGLGAFLALLGGEITRHFN